MDQEIGRLFPRSFAGVWTPLCPSGALRKKPIARRLAGVDVALFRDKQGGAHALLDRCPHRGVKLSLGKVTEDGCLECPFHGWRFGGDGACTHVPLSGALGDDKRRNLFARSLPVVERGGLVFVFTGSSPVDEPYVPPALLQAGVARHVIEKTWATHWTRAMENMLDWPHVPFVHKRTIGAGMKKMLVPNARMEIDLTDTPWGFRSRERIFVDELQLDGDPPGGDMLSESGGFLDWNRPNGMTLNIPMPLGLWRQHVWCVPIDETHVNMLIVTVRGFGRYNPVWRLVDEFNRRVLFEDQGVVESSFPVEVPPASEEKSVATDRPTLRFRRWYRARLHSAEEASALRALAD